MGVNGRRALIQFHSWERRAHDTAHFLQSMVAESKA
jgi:hypothetical protein